MIRLTSLMNSVVCNLINVDLMDGLDIWPINNGEIVKIVDKRTMQRIIL